MLRWLVVSLVAWGALTPPALAQSDDAHPCDGMRIEGLKLEGCAGVWCAAGHERAKLLSLTDIRTGMRWYEDRLIEPARRRLEATGFFRSAEIHCEPNDAETGAFVRIRVHPHRWIRKVVITGNSALYESDILKRMFLREGTAYNPKDEVSEEDKRRQERLIKKRYQKEGFDDASVTIEAREVGGDEVTLFVTILENKKKRLAGVDVQIKAQLAKPPPNREYPYGADIRCATFSERRIRKASGLSSGDIFTERLREQARRKVRTFLRRRGIVKAKVDLRFNERERRAHIHVSYDRCFVLRVRIRHDALPGLRGFTDGVNDELLSTMSFDEGGTFDLMDATRNRHELEEYYQRQGYLFVDVRMIYRRLELKKLSWTPSVRGVITYRVTLRYKSEIRNITFKGNKALKDGELVEKMTTRTYDSFGDGGYLLVPQMLRDLIRLRDAYRQLGYYRMGFGGAPKAGKGPEHIRMARKPHKTDEVYTFTLSDMQFRLRKHPEESVIYLEVDIDEGPRSMVGEVELKGVPTGAVAELRTGLKAQPGSHFAPGGIASDRTVIERYFQTQGHPEVRIDTRCRGWEGGAIVADLRPGKKGEPACDWQTIRAGKVDVLHEIRPGPTVTVGEIFVRGNNRTDRDLITDELPQAGVPLNRAKLDEAERKIRSLGVFSSVQVKLVGLEPPVRKKIAIVVSLQERPAQTVDVTVGVESMTREDEPGLPPWFTSGITTQLGLTDSAVRGTTDGTPLDAPDILLYAGATYRHRNFLGKALELELPFRYGISVGGLLESTALMLGVSSSQIERDDPVRGLYRLAELRPTLYVPGLFGTDFTAISLFTRFDTATTVLEELEAGGAISATWVFFGHLRLILGVAASAIRGVEPQDGLINALQDGAGLQPRLQINLHVTLDYLDNPIHPTRGFSVSARTAYIISPELDTDALNNFLKWDLSATYVWNVRRVLIVAFNARYADSFSFTSDFDSIPDRERFVLGGIFGVRGIPDGGIKPVREDGEATAVLGGDSLFFASVEARVPVIKQLDIWLAGFFDLGALGEETADLGNIDAYRPTAGIGLRWLAGGQIPIRIDYGFNLSRRCQAPQTADPAVNSDGTCTQGLEPLGEVEFGLLYTF